jgi:hypothetical protein
MVSAMTLARPFISNASIFRPQVVMFRDQILKVAVEPLRSENESLEIVRIAAPCNAPY